MDPIIKVDAVMHKQMLFPEQVIKEAEIETKRKEKKKKMKEDKLSKKKQHKEIVESKPHVEIKFVERDSKAGRRRHVANVLSKMSETRHFFRQGGQLKHTKDFINDPTYQYIRQARGLEPFLMSDLDTARTVDAEIVKVIIPQKSDSHQKWHSEAGPKEPQSMTSANIDCPKGLSAQSQQSWPNQGFRAEAQELLKKQPINDEHNYQMKDVIIIGDDWI